MTPLPRGACVGVEIVQQVVRVGTCADDQEDLNAEAR